MSGGAWLFAGGLAFELLLGAFAWWMAPWLGVEVTPSWPATAREFAIAVGVTMPPLAFLRLGLRARTGPLAKVREEARAALGDFLSGRGLFALLALAAAAGWGEELLFRGCLQPWIARFVPVPAAVALAALGFGLLHALSAAYATYAAAVGCYLGASAAWSGSLAGPILAHAAYDFAAFLALRSPAAPSPTEAPQCPQD